MHTFAAVIVEHMPAQRSNTHPGAGVAVSVTDVPEAYSQHAAPHVAPTGFTATEPRPRCRSAYRRTGVKRTITVLLASTTTSHVGVAVGQPPAHAASAEPCSLGVAVNRTVVPVGYRYEQNANSQLCNNPGGSI